MGEIYKMKKSIILSLGLALVLLSSTPDEHRGLGVSQYKGCPGNALCSQKTGRIRHQWKQLLSQSRNHPKRTEQLETFRLRQGIPLEVWTLVGKPSPGVHFDSSCKQWMQSEVFAPDFTQLTEEVVVRRGYLLRQKTVEIWNLPRGDVPLYERKKRLYYNRHFEGEYYGISIGIKGDVRMEKNVTPLKPYDFPQQTPCPQKLLDHFAKNAHSTRPDHHPLCLRLPGHSRQPLTLLLGTGCS